MLLRSFTKKETGRTWQYFSRLLSRHFPPSLTNSRGSRVAGRGSRVSGRGSNVAVAGPMSRSRVQCRGRGSKVAVAGPMSRSRVQSRGRGSNVAAGENDLEFEVTE